MKSSTLIVGTGASLALIAWYIGVIMITRLSMGLGSLEPEPLFYVESYFRIPYDLLAYFVPQNLNQTIAGAVLFEGMAYAIHCVVYTFFIWLVLKIFRRPKVAT